MTTPATTPRQPFETEPCPRCGGSGTYSRCEMWGTTCFECGYAKGIPGTGRRYTKRGKAARDFYASLRPVKRAADLVPGDRAKVQGYKGYLAVEAVTPAAGSVSWTVDGVKQTSEGRGYLDVAFKGITYGCVAPDYTFKMAWTAEEQAAALAKALAYQATLTKAGTVAKRPRKEV